MTRLICFIILVGAGSVYSLEPDAGLRANLKFPNEVTGVFDLDARPVEVGGGWVVTGGAQQEGNGTSGFFAKIDRDGNIVESQVLPAGAESFSMLRPLPSGDRIAAWVLRAGGKRLDLGQFDASSNQDLSMNSLSILEEGSMSVVDQDYSGALVLIDSDQKLYLVKINAIGAVLWVTLIDSPEFSREGSGLLGVTESMVFSDGYVLSLIQSKSAFVDGNSVFLYSLFLISFDNDGNLIWSRKVETVGMYPQVAVDAGGNVFVSAVKEFSGRQENYPEYTWLLKIGASGEKQWSIKIEDTACSFVSGLSDGRAVFRNFGSNWEQDDVLEYLIMDQEGELSGGLRILYAADEAFAFAADDKIWLDIDTYRFNDSEIASRNSPIIGWFSLDLSESRWIRYTRKTKFSRLLPNPNGDKLLFLASLADGAGVDCIEIDPSFDEGSTDGLWRSADVVVGPVSVESSAIDWSVAELGVTIQDSSFATLESDRGLVPYGVELSDLGSDFGNRVPEESEVRKISVEEGSLVLQMPSLPGIRYIIESSDNLQPGTWRMIGEFVGTGFQDYFVQSLWEDGRVAFIRITKFSE